MKDGAALSDLPPDVDAFRGIEVIVGLPSSTATGIGSQILGNSFSRRERLNIAVTTRSQTAPPS